MGASLLSPQLGRLVAIFLPTATVIGMLSAFFRIAVRSEGNASTVSVLNEAGAPESSANAERIVRVIADELK